MFILIHPDARYVRSNFLLFILHLKLFFFFLFLARFSIYLFFLIYLFIYNLNFPVFVCLEFLWDTLFALVLVKNKNKWTIFFLAGLVHPCLFPAPRLFPVCSLFDIIWPTCLLSKPVCFTLCLSAFIFVLMFTWSKGVFVLSCLCVLWSEEVCRFCVQNNPQRWAVSYLQRPHAQAAWNFGTKMSQKYITF